MLQLAEQQPFARKLVNSGRLSTPTPYLQSPLNTPDADVFAGLMQPGTNCADAPVKRPDGRSAWFLNLLGDGFTLLVFDAAAPAQAQLEWAGLQVPVLTVGRDVMDADGLLAQRYDGRPGTAYLIRPDHHVAARWRHFEVAAVHAALVRATGQMSARWSRAPMRAPPVASAGTLRAPAARLEAAPDQTPVTLQLQPNLPEPDGFYEELMASVRGLKDEEAEQFQARLLLVLANHVGHRDVLREAMRVAAVKTAESQA